MNRVFLFLALLCCLMMAGLASGQAAEGAPEPSPAQITGRCLQTQQRLRGLRDELEQAIDAPTHRLATLQAALQIIDRSRQPDADQARQLRAQAGDLREQIDGQQDLLRGEARPANDPVDRDQVRRALAKLYRDLDRVRLLLRAHTVEDAWARQRLQADLAFEKLELEARIDALREPYQERIERLQEQVGGYSEALEEAMKRFARRGVVGEVEAEAVRVDCRLGLGLILLSWNDRRGQVVASAQMSLRSAPEISGTPPLLAQRYPILRHNAQEVTMRVGFFEVQFHAQTAGLNGKQRLLEAVKTFLDLEGLEAVVPQVGQGLTN